MATYDRALDIVQGFNFKKDVQKAIGFLTKLKIGTETITPDMTVNSPMAATATVTSATADVGALKVVAVLEKATWEMGDTDPLQFEGNLSIAGKQAFSALLYSAMIDIDVEIGFVVYEYDALAKKYFAAFSNSAQGTTDASATGVLGQIKKDGENLAMTIEMEPHDTVQSPINYKFTLQVVPKPKAQILKFATSSTRKVTKNWGRVGPT
jgi:hypothetical protein